MEAGAKFTLDKVRVKTLLVSDLPSALFSGFDLKVQVQHGDLHEGCVGRQSRAQQRSRRTHAEPRSRHPSHTPRVSFLEALRCGAVRECWKL